MSPTLERVEIKEKPKLGGGGPGKIPHRRGYGGGDDGDHGQPDDFRSGKDRLRRFRIGIAAGIVSVGVLFVGLTTAYMLRQRTGGRWTRRWAFTSPIGIRSRFPTACCSSTR